LKIEVTMMKKRKILLITNDNHTLGIQTVANIIHKKLGILPELFYLPSNLPEYPHSIEAKIIQYIIREVDEANGKILIGKRYLGSLTDTECKQWLTFINKIRYDDIISLAYSRSNPIDEIHFN
jgi:hypothetical protein